MTQRDLTCCCCGDDAGRFEQHWNRDTGYGICAKCVAEEMGRPDSAEHLEELYGKPDVNYRRPMITHQGRRFACLAVFPNTEAGTKAANAFMERMSGAAVLCVTDAVYLADVSDQGVPIAGAKGA